jgi:thiamine-phosphate pyrophosphorylase
VLPYLADKYIQYKFLTVELILISYPEDFPNENDILIRLFQNGLNRFHLRKPGVNFAKYEKLIQAIPATYHPKIVIHSFHELAEKYALGGIHYPETQRNSESSKKLPGKQISTSFHTIDDLKNSGSAFDYMFLSPVFNSISKVDYAKGFDHAILAREIKNINMRVVALGGIGMQTLGLVKEIGFYGAALLGSVWNSKDPLESFKSLLLKAKELT